MTSSYPPMKVLPSTSISPTKALNLLTNYLTTAQNSPCLLPNARLEASGPTAGSLSSSVTIHNLQRVEAGLRGEWLAPVLNLQEGSSEAMTRVDDGASGIGEAKGTEGEWMDLEEYQRQQSVEGPEQNQEDLAVEDGALGGLENGQEIEENFSATTKNSKQKRKLELVDKNELNPLKDPQARKREKKERHKAEKKAKEEARKKASIPTA